MEDTADYKKMYMALFNHMTTAIQELEQMNYGRAKEILIDGQQKAAEIYLAAEDR